MSEIINRSGLKAEQIEDSLKQPLNTLPDYLKPSVTLADAEMCSCGGQIEQVGKIRRCRSCKKFA